MNTFNSYLSFEFDLRSMKTISYTYNGFWIIYFCILFYKLAKTLITKVPLNFLKSFPLKKGNIPPCNVKTEFSKIIKHIVIDWIISKMVFVRPSLNGKVLMYRTLYILNPILTELQLSNYRKCNLDLGNSYFYVKLAKIIGMGIYFEAEN